MNFRNLEEYRDYLKAEVAKNPASIFNSEMLKIVEKELGGA